MASSWSSKCDDMDTFGSHFASNSAKILEKRCSIKTCFLNKRQNARPEVMGDYNPTRDVRPRRRNAAIFNGKVKAGRQKAPHLGPGFKPKGGTSDNQT